jgi:hypothetical protein
MRRGPWHGVLLASLMLSGTALLILPIWSCSSSKSSAGDGGPCVYFPEPTFSFGTIPQGTSVSHTFKVQNVGDKPLKLIRAKGS